ncbi:hypothetical protein BG011_001997, partial [Mortierella polycephala]
MDIRYLLNDDREHTNDGADASPFQADYSMFDEGWEVEVIRGHYEGESVIASIRQNNALLDEVKETSESDHVE